MGDAHEARRPAVSYIGQPIHFASGQFAGQTVRTKLIEVQKAELGRKYARVDRRPLDPPPAVLLKLYVVYNPGTEAETEREVDNYDDVQNLGLLCNVDLFPVPTSVIAPTNMEGFEERQLEPTSSHHTAYNSSTSSDYHLGQHQFSLSAYGQQHHQHSVPMPPHIIIPPQPHQQEPHSAGPYYSPADTSHDIVAYVGSHAVVENSKCTNALVGQTFVQPANVDYKGEKALMFVFADLAVKIEGSFILRYRVFDIFSKKYNDNELVIQAECYGGPFRVYSTKEFPGLHASTDLTKQLARWGVRLNIRETERKRRKKGERRSSSPPSAISKRRGKPNEYNSADD